MPATGRVVLGRAVTHGQALPLGSDDPVVAARAVRRALADAGHRAVDVRHVVLVTRGPVGPDVLAAFVRRALGPHGATVRARGMAVVPPVVAHQLAALAVPEADDDISQDGVVIAVGIGDDGDVVALCLGRAVTAPGAGSRPPAAT